MLNDYELFSIIIFCIGFCISLFYTETGFFIRLNCYKICYEKSFQPFEFFMLYIKSPTHNFTYLDEETNIKHLKQLYIIIINENTFQVKQRSLLSNTTDDDKISYECMKNFTNIESCNNGKLLKFAKEHKMKGIESYLNSIIKNEGEMRINSLNDAIIKFNRIYNCDNFSCNYLNLVNSFKNQITTLKTTYPDAQYTQHLFQLNTRFNNFINTLKDRKILKTYKTENFEYNDFNDVQINIIEEVIEV